MAAPCCPSRSSARPLCPRSRPLRPKLHVHQYAAEVTKECKRFVLRAAVREQEGASGAEDAAAALRWQVRGTRLQACCS